MNGSALRAPRPGGRSAPAPQRSGPAEHGHPNARRPETPPEGSCLPGPRRDAQSDLSDLTADWSPKLCRTGTGHALYAARYKAEVKNIDNAVAVNVGGAGYHLAPRAKDCGDVIAVHEAVARDVRDS